MKIEICQDPKYWNQLVKERKTSTFFHRYEWGKMMELLEKVQFYPFIVKDSDDEYPLPVFSQNEKWSWSLLGYGGPCPSEKHKISFPRLLNEMEKIQQSPTTRIALPFYANFFYDIEGSKEWNYRQTHILYLPETYDVLWKNCSGKARTGVRYAKKHNIHVKVLSLDAIPDFYKLYVDLNERIGAGYILPIEFFHKLYEIYSLNEFYPIAAYLDDEMIAASLYFFDTQGGYYWIHVNNSQGRKYQASYLLLENAFKFAISLGIDWFDLGYSHSYSIMRPKEYWGAKPVQCNYYEKVI